MYKYNNLIVAGISTPEEFAEWLSNGKPETGYHFVRKLDNFNMGSHIYLGMDYSEVQYGLANQPREDSENYYREEQNPEENEGDNNGE